MNKKLMQQQESQIKNFQQSEVETETINIAYRYVIDSVIEDKFRLLTSEPKIPISRGTTAKQLASFDLWKESMPKVVELKNVFREIGVRRNQIKEGKVFVKLENKTFDLTEFVRQEVKDHYCGLLKREFASPEKKEAF